MAAEARRYGALRVWAAEGVDPVAAIAPSADPDMLLTRIDCRLLKLQRKVMVGRVATAAGTLYVKRYNVFAWRIGLGSIGRASPALRAWRAAEALEARGFAVPDRIVAVEHRTAGILRRSFLVTREVPDAVTADQRWTAMLHEAPGPTRRRARRALARALGALFRRLHDAGVYHSDLKDVNVLVRGPGDRPECVLLDLECVHLAAVPFRRRVKNLMQLDRTLGRLATRADRVRVLHAYLGADAPRSERQRWARAALTAAAAKDAGRPRPVVDRPVPSLTTMVVCQNEERQLEACLESVEGWCDELIVVDGGSRDRTVEIARRFTDRVIEHPWPGYRAQKQFALDQTRTQWVFNVDADERIPHEVRDEILAVLPHVAPGVAALAVPRLVPYLGRWWFRSGWYPRRVVRVFRREATRWGGTDPHEKAIVEGGVMQLENAIIHYTYADVNDHLRAVGKLTRVAVAEVPLGRRIGVGRLLLDPPWRFVRAYVLRRAAYEGFPGYFVAATDAFYVFLRWAAVWTRGRNSDKA